MSKLVRCTAGSILDVAVDLRLGSPTFGRWVAEELNAENMHQVFATVGFGLAYLTLSHKDRRAPGLAEYSKHPTFRAQP